MAKGERRADGDQSSRSRFSLFLQVTVGQKPSHFITQPNDFPASALLLNIADHRRNVFLDHVIEVPVLGSAFKGVQASPSPAKGKIPHIKPFLGQERSQAGLLTEIKEQTVDEKTVTEDYRHWMAALFRHVQPLQGKLESLSRHGPVKLLGKQRSLPGNGTRGKKEKEEKENRESRSETGRLQFLSSMMATTELKLTTSPSLARTSLNSPESGASISTLTLSVSTSSKGSPALTLSPFCLSQRKTLTSSLSSLDPSRGITTSFFIRACPERFMPQH